MEEIIKLYESLFGVRPGRVEALTASASPRRYFRVSAAPSAPVPSAPVPSAPAPSASHPSVIATVGTSAAENDAFIYLSGHFASKGLPVPKIFGRSADGMVYCQEDLGDRTLWDALAPGRREGYSEGEVSLLKQAMVTLADFQCRGEEGLDWSRCYQQTVFDRRSVLFDLHYFKYCFLKNWPGGREEDGTGRVPASSGGASSTQGGLPSRGRKLEFDENLLEDEFERMADIITSVPCDGFLYRDFQPRNMMCGEDGALSFIDYQGGRRGPVYYDVASFVWQASAEYPDGLREALIDTYLTSLGRYRNVDRREFMGMLRHFVLLRTLQVLGAYGFRGLCEGKVRFRRSIPSALRNLSSLFTSANLFGTPLEEYPYIASLVRRLAASGGEQPAGLTVEVYSFSYMQGIPDDASGNGGGFVFDCRGMENPGRVPCFRHSTGLDADVAAWLEARGQVQRFLAAVYVMADAHVECFLRRGLSHLMLCFGCTGGQHRSVYCARHVAEHIAGRFAAAGVRVVVIHRERGLVSELTGGAFGQGGFGAGASVRVDTAVAVSAPAGTALASDGDVPGPCLILAAGMGTRLRPLTDHVPKALAPVGGRPLVCSLIDRLYGAGWRRVTVNLHHRADMLETYLRFAQRDCWAGMDIAFSDERDRLLDTGGAVKKVLGGMCAVGGAAGVPSGADAAAGLSHRSRSAAPLLVHNVDIVCDADLGHFYRLARRMLEASDGAVAVLMVSGRESSRKLYFDAGGRLRGWKNLTTGEVKGFVRDGESAGVAFSGIYVISSGAHALMQDWPDTFSIIDFFLSVCLSRDVLCLEMPPECRITDVGKF